MAESNASAFATASTGFWSFPATRSTAAAGGLQRGAFTVCERLPLQQIAAAEMVDLHFAECCFRIIGARGCSEEFSFVRIERPEFVLNPVASADLGSENVETVLKITHGVCGARGCGTIIRQQLTGGFNRRGH
jgi:hypothetical protein